jgi:signal transduction histidine kinase
MKLLSGIRRRLVVKLFLSYLLIIFTGIIVLAISAQFVFPTAFDRHMGDMMGDSGMMGGRGMMGGESMGSDLYSGFLSAAGDALFRAGLAAFVLALGVSILISRKIVEPLQKLTQASLFIAEGHFDQRVDIPGSDNPTSIDELGQLAITFNRMAEKLDQTETMRRQLIGDVSHELRTPLTTIKGSMEGLLDGVLEPTPETFENIHREASRLQRLVSDLQVLSQVESGAVPLRATQANLIPLIEVVCSRLKPQFLEKGVSLEVDLKQSLPPVIIDEDRISQVLINLLGNALQYTPKGGIVWLSAETTDDVIEISVKDSGIGIPAEHIPHLFTRFYRVDKSRSRAGGGSGIGLTIAKHIVAIHGGHIWAESHGLGKGSKFTFTIPTTEQKSEI